jgi:uncharacterized protein YkwD
MRFVSIVFLLLFTHTSLAGEWLEALNTIRKAHALPPLREAAELDRLAEDWAKELARRGRLEHRPDLDAFLSPGGWKVLLENVLASRPPMTPREILASWMESPSHRHNLLDPEIDSCGFGMVRSADDRAYVVWNGGRRGVPR